MASEQFDNNGLFDIILKVIVFIEYLVDKQQINIFLGQIFTPQIIGDRLVFYY